MCESSVFVVVSCMIRFIHFIKYGYSQFTGKRWSEHIDKKLASSFSCYWFCFVGGSYFVFLFREPGSFVIDLCWRAAFFELTSYSLLQSFVIICFKGILARRFLNLEKSKLKILFLYLIICFYYVYKFLIFF